MKSDKVRLLVNQSISLIYLRFIRFLSASNCSFKLQWPSACVVLITSSFVNMSLPVWKFPLELSRDITEKLSVMGTPSLPTFLKSYWLTPVQMTGQLSRSMQIACKYWQAERQYKCSVCDNYVRIFSFTLLNNLDYGLNYYSSQLRFSHSREGLDGRSSAAFRWVWHFLKDESVCPRSVVDLNNSGDELMPTPVMSSCRLNVCILLTPLKLQDRTSARLLTSPFHAGAESWGQIQELRFLMSPHGKTHCLSMQPPASERHSAVCKAQSLGSSLIHTIPAPHQRLPCVEDTLSFTDISPTSAAAVCRGYSSHSHDTSPTSVAAVCRGLCSLTHSRWYGALAVQGVTSSPCAEKCAKARGLWCPCARRWGVTWRRCAEKRAKPRNHLTPLCRKSARSQGVTWCPGAHPISLPDFAGLLLPVV